MGPLTVGAARSAAVRMVERLARTRKHRMFTIFLRNSLNALLIRRRAHRCAQVSTDGRLWVSAEESVVPRPPTAPPATGRVDRSPCETMRVLPKSAATVAEAAESARPTQPDRDCCPSTYPEIFAG